MKISKEEFVKIINRLKETDDTVRKINQLLRDTYESVHSDFSNGAAMSISFEDVVVSLLQNMFNDEGDWIGYWLYELDYGREYTDGCVREANGDSIDISTPEKLYDFLIEEDTK